MNVSRALFSVYQKFAPPNRDEVLSMIHKKIKLRSGEMRRGWMVKAAAWVKKRHIDRGDKKVGLLLGQRRFQVIEDLLPRYVVPDLSSTKLRPYVTSYISQASNASSKKSG